MTGGDPQATCCATLVDEWVARGVRHAVVAPGSRSTPMALALTGRPELAVHVVHDERSAAFIALGAGLSGVPAVLLCTSGTAAANFLPAVVEAGLSAVPVLVVTADRPPELHDVGASQTIDQTRLYGAAVRWFHDPGVPTMAGAATWRSLARRAFDAAAGGPVHLNLPFREPLVGAPGALPPRRPVVGRSAPPAPEVADGLVALLDRPWGVILAGGGGGVSADDVAALATATGWPVLADATSGVRHLATAVTTSDALLRHPGFAASHRPDVAVRLGRPATSRVLAEWIAGSAATLVQVGGPGVVDPDHTAVAVLDALALTALARRLGNARDTAWSAGWCDANREAEAAIDTVLDAHDALSEPDVARTVARHLPTAARLVVAASMPMRDVEWYGGPPARAHANRGANGIDGVMSTAVGVALDGGPVVALVGDVAFVHDAGALTALAWRDVDLRIVVVDNDGGGIFSFLPQAGLLPTDRFEQLFGTPHGTDLVALAAAHGLDATTVTTRDGLIARLSAPGPSVTRIPTDRQANVAVHAALHAAIAATLS